MNLGVRVREKINGWVVVRLNHGLSAVTEQGGEFQGEFQARICPFI